MLNNLNPYLVAGFGRNLVYVNALRFIPIHQVDMRLSFLKVNGGKPLYVGRVHIHVLCDNAYLFSCKALPIGQGV